jgi:hypothetical protein
VADQGINHDVYAVNLLVQTVWSILRISVDRAPSSCSAGLRIRFIETSSGA